MVANLTLTTDPGVARGVTLVGNDADGNPLSFRIVSQPTHGTVGLSGATATYHPDSGYTGADAFTYAAWDGSTNSNLGAVSVGGAAPSVTPTATVPAATRTPTRPTTTPASPTRTPTVARTATTAPTLTATRTPTASRPPTRTATVRATRTPTLAIVRPAASATSTIRPTRTPTIRVTRTSTVRPTRTPTGAEGGDD